MNSDEVFNLPSTSSSSDPASNSLDACAICGDKVYSRRHGAPACLGCTVFFRRAVMNNTQCRCFKDQECAISIFRGACRYCRFQKCLRVGLKPDSVWKKDSCTVKNIEKKSLVKPDLVIKYENTEQLLNNFATFQRKQHQKHLQYFSDHKVDIAYRRDDHTNFISFRRRARSQDVSVTLKLCFEQATEFGNRLKPFKRLTLELKKSVLSEYFLAFLLIDQAFKTSRTPDQGIWLFQNESFMHPDYFFGSSAADLVDSENIRHHHNFVTDFLESLANPFRRLKIDEIECVALKILLLLKPSCSKRAIYAGQEGLVAKLFTCCSEELMNHCSTKNRYNAAERFGELLLLIGSIRVGVKTIYNQTKVSDLFDFNELDSSVLDLLLK